MHQLSTHSPPSDFDQRQPAYLCQSAFLLISFYFLFPQQLGSSVESTYRPWVSKEITFSCEHKIGNKGQQHNNCVLIYVIKHVSWILTPGSSSRLWNHSFFPHYKYFLSSSANFRFRCSTLSLPAVRNNKDGNIPLPHFLHALLSYSAFEAQCLSINYSLGLYNIITKCLTSFLKPKWTEQQSKT